MSAVTRVNLFDAAPGKADELAAFLQSLVSYIANSEGCLGCEVLRGTPDDDHFAVIERWASTEAHQQSLANYPKADMQAAMPLFGQPPQGRYYQTTAIQ